MKTIINTLLIASALAAGAAFAEPAVGPDNDWLKATPISSAPAPSAAAADRRDAQVKQADHIHVEDAAPGQSFSPNP